MLSDDGGDTFRVSSASGFGKADKFANENQAVELGNGSVLINARSLANPGDVQRRIQTISFDGGATFPATRYVPELPQPLDGCEGSTVASPDGENIFFSGPDSTFLREKMTVWRSTDSGETYQKITQLDTGMSGYSSLQLECNSTAHPQCSSLFLLYEQSDETQIVMDPDRFIFRRINLIP